MNINNKVMVHAYKYNGWLYRTWEFPCIIKETDEYLCVSSDKSHVITSSPDGKHFYHSKITRPTIWYFFKNKWFNMIVSEKGKKFYYYINIASPYIFEEEAIKYIDFDLDFRIPDAKGNIINELDLGEFNENKVIYKYPEKILEKIKITEDEIKRLFQSRYFDKYLDESLIKGNKKVVSHYKKANYV